MSTNNHDLFPRNIFPAEELQVGNVEYRILRARFSNLYELYEYLKGNPEINRDIFHDLSSLTGSRDFAGKPYDQAVEDLVGELDPGYNEFLRLQRDINARKAPIHKYRTIKTVAGGHLNIPAYSAGNPLCYETEERIYKPKFASIHVMLSYYWGTTKSQVLNRAIIITNILKALESAGYSVDLNTFELSAEEDELAYITVQIKKHGSTLDMQAIYKTLCHVEFLRRILFRILETLDVENYWASGYGQTCDERFTRKALNLGQNDIFFDQPREMRIQGEDLVEDFENAINHLNLGDKIDIDKAKRDFSETSKILAKRP